MQHARDVINKTSTMVIDPPPEYLCTKIAELKREKAKVKEFAKTKIIQMWSQCCREVGIEGIDGTEVFRLNDIKHAYARGKAEIMHQRIGHGVLVQMFAKRIGWELDLEKQYMDANNIEYIEKESAAGKGCIARLIVEKKNDLVRQVRDVAFKTHNSKYRTREPVKYEEGKRKRGHYSSLHYDPGCVRVSKQRTIEPQHDNAEDIGEQLPSLHRHEWEKIQQVLRDSSAGEMKTMAMRCA